MPQLARSQDAYDRFSATVASYFVGQRADADMTELHRRLDRIEAALTRLAPAAPAPAAPAPAPAATEARGDHARGGLRCMR
jgi:hypothetical protein